MHMKPFILRGYSDKNLTKEAADQALEKSKK